MNKERARIDALKMSLTMLSETNEDVQKAKVLYGYYRCATLYSTAEQLNDPKLWYQKFEKRVWRNESISLSRIPISAQQLQRRGRSGQCGDVGEHLEINLMIAWIGTSIATVDNIAVTLVPYCFLLNSLDCSATPSLLFLHVPSLPFPPMFLVLSVQATSPLNLYKPRP
jgi:hypothetical protein